MRHRHGGFHLNRPTDERIALYRTMMVSFLTHDRIQTTEAKAKAIQPQIEKLITIARDNTVAHRRLVLAKLPVPMAVDRLFHEVAPRMIGRPGGYTRITKLGPRKGDNAPMALLELVEGVSPASAPAAVTPASTGSTTDTSSAGQ